MISDVKAYARTRMDALGYTEWTDGFNHENIPRTRLDEYYTVELGEVRGIQNNQNYQQIEAFFTVRIFKSPGPDPKALIDDMVVQANAMVAAFIDPVNRTTWDGGLKNVSFNTLAIEPLDESNDNGIIARVEFTGLVILSTS